MKWLLILLFIPCISFASNITNPGGGGGGSLTPNSTFYIQNTFTPTTNTQVFSVQQGSFSVAGYFMQDTAGCIWKTTIATSGALVTTLDHCPSAGGMTGQCIGILCGVTYAN